MHELSLAEAIVAIAERHAGGRRVCRVDVQIGHLRQAVPSALAFAFELVVQGTALDGAELVLHEVPAAGRCRSCGAESRLDGVPLAGGACGGQDVEVIAGEELQVESLEVEAQEEEVAYER
jgi:hydrogenase nickel incorporation protein HypA/HybF